MFRTFNFDYFLAARYLYFAENGEKKRMFQHYRSRAYRVVGIRCDKLRLREREREKEKTEFAVIKAKSD